MNINRILEENAEDISEIDGTGEYKDRPLWKEVTEKGDFIREYQDGDESFEIEVYKKNIYVIRSKAEAEDGNVNWNYKKSYKVLNNESFIKVYNEMIENEKIGDING
jgi:hypothetical protein